MKNKIEFSHFDELISALKGITTQEMENACTEEKFKEKIIHTISNVENLVLLIKELSDYEVSNLLLYGIKGNINYIVNSITELKILLKNLTSEQCKVICESLKGEELYYWREFYMHTFKETLEELTLEKYRFMLPLFEKDLPSIINDNSDFSDVFELLDPEQHGIVCGFLKEHLPSIVENTSDFRNIFVSLDSKQHGIVCEFLKEKLPSIVENILDLEAVFKSLNSETRSEHGVVCETLKERLPSIIVSSANFVTALKVIDQKQHRILCEILKEQLPSIIVSSAEFVAALKVIDREQQGVVCEILKEQLPSIIVSSKNFAEISKHLDLKHHGVVCETLKEQLPSIVKNISEFENVFKYLDSKQCEIVFESLKEQLSSIVSSTDDFCCVIKYIDFQKLITFLAALKGKLPSIIHDIDELGSFLENLTEEQCKELCKLLKDQPLSITVDPVSFNSTSRFIKSQRRAAFCEILVEKLSLAIKTSNDFYAIFEYLVHKTRVFNKVKDKLPLILIKDSDFRSVLECVDFEEREFIFNTQKEKLSSIINKLNLKIYLQYFSAEKLLPIYYVELEEKNKELEKENKQLKERNKQLEERLESQKEVESPRSRTPTFY